MRSWPISSTATTGSTACQSAADGAAALRLLQTEAVDAVFLDIRMPGLDGLDLARVLRRFASPPSIVFVTAYDDHAVDAFDLRAVDYVLKPVRTERLARGGRPRRRGTADRAVRAAPLDQVPGAAGPSRPAGCGSRPRG